MEEERPGLPAGELEGDDIVTVFEKPATIHLDVQQATKNPKIPYQANLINKSTGGEGTQIQGNSSGPHATEGKMLCWQAWKTCIV